MQLAFPTDLGRSKCAPWLYAKAREQGVAVSPMTGMGPQENVAAVSLTLDQMAVTEFEPLARSIAGIAI